MEFVALDFETVNADMSSICQIGLVLFKDGSLQEEWKTYVDPEDFFDDINSKGCSETSGYCTSYMQLPRWSNCRLPHPL